MKYIFILIGLLFAQFALAANHFDKVVYIVFENENSTTVMSNDYFKSIANSYTYFSNFNAETHPSQGNYIAMISGSTYNIVSDKNIDLDGQHLGDLLENKKLTWKAYAENYPGNCFLDKTSGNYARKHVPFLSFKNVSTNFNRCANVESDATFFSDLASNNLPTFSMYTPNLLNDGHNTNVPYAANWLKSKFGNFIAHPESYPNVLLIITFDEGTTIGRNQIYTVAIGNMVKNGGLISQKLNHYSLLKMIEDEFSLGNLGKGDASEPVIQGLWK